MLVSVLPFEFEYREHLLLWKRYARREELIDWEVAKEYFRKPQVYINAMVDPPVIGPDWASVGVVDL